MIRKKPDVDVISDVLQLTLDAYPNSTFVRSLQQQYIERGGLSKKQLEGLHKKASNIKSIAPGKLATIEAVILKRPNRYKSDLPENRPLYDKDPGTGKLLDDILSKYPEHKRVLFLKMKYEGNEILSATELAELERFHKLLR